MSAPAPLPEPKQEPGPETRPETLALPGAVPDVRHYLAAERTLLAWIRTGIATMAFGFLVGKAGLALRVLGFEEHSVGGTGGTVFGSALLAIGVAINVMAAYRFIVVHRDMVQGRAFSPSISGPVTLAALVATAGAILMAALMLGLIR